MSVRGTRRALAEGMQSASRFDPKLDVVFKMLFARPVAHELLVALLNDVLQPTSPIVSVTLLNPDLVKDSVSDRGLVLDLHARLADGRLIDVEMQMRREQVIKRAVYAVSRLYRSQLEAGDEYKKLRPCIAIVFLGCRRLPGEAFHSKYRLCDVQTGKELCDELEVHFVELPKLPPAHTEEYNRAGGLARWASFLRNDDEELMRELEMSDPRIAKARALLRELAQDPEAQQIVREREEAQLLYQMELEAAAERASAEGEAKGRAEGEAKGRAEGEAKGRAEGEAKGRVEGEAKAKADALITVIEARGLFVTEAQRTTISSCSDSSTLDRWLAAAVTAESVQELLRG